MPQKPHPTRKRRDGRIEANPYATALTGLTRRRKRKDRVSPELPGALQIGNADITAFASERYYADADAGKPALGRYTRVIDEIMKKFGCSMSTAKRNYRDAELIRAHDAEQRRPTLQARALEQLHRIADREEERQPLAAVAALREIARIAGLHAPKELKVTHSGSVEVDHNLDAIIDVLDEIGRAAMRTVLAQIEAAKACGRLALPSGDEPMDAVIVEPDGSN